MINPLKAALLTLLITTMNNAISNELYSSRGENHLKVTSAVATSLCNAMERFKETGQDLRHFDIVIERGEGVVLVSFNAKRALGEKTLGGRTSLGKSVTYHTSPVDGSIIKEQGQR